jgi:hypothetical protein
MIYFGNKVGRFGKKWGRFGEKWGRFGSGGVLTCYHNFISTSTSTLLNCKWSKPHHASILKTCRLCMQNLENLKEMI